ncbi:GGDEF domain-containing protein [Shewanella loihica]|uniref:diguanylate cyclase n=1 Tax=Shewanella loihica (strain ATCC BAA-1088 / PV-4) TaxID=323850 RepID=A3QI98_SHELP|nr:GGDEF domain-containing protein [Shewanella loihica]ABO25196.1 diguanylate cyclase [Shewanella loihica PV-4]
MNIDPIAELLVLFICLLASTSTLAWGLMAYPLRIAPRASTYFSLANLLILTGVLLTTLRDQTPSYLYWLGADMLLLLGFVLLRSGTQRLFRLSSSIKIDLALLLLTGLSMLTQPPSIAASDTLGIFFSFMAASTFLLMAKDNLVALEHTVKRPIAVILLSPIALMGVIFGLRALLLLIEPALKSHLASIQSADAIPMLWLYVVMTLWINVIMMGNALTRLVQKMRQQADRDYLTGLWNRRAMQQQLEQLHQRWLRDGQAYSLILFDLDFFKQINDKFGHSAGDAVLVKTAQQIGKVTRAMDIFCRLGGEEFLLVLPGTDGEVAEIIAQKLQQALRQSSLNWQGSLIPISASFGIVTTATGDTPDSLLALADKAMYRAKETGRDRCCTAERRLEQAQATPSQ